MPRVPITMPQLGESIAEAKILRLLVKVGDQVEVDQEIIEVETSKATMAVTTLCAGTMLDFICEEDVTYAVNSVLGFIEATEEEIAKTGVMTTDQLESGTKGSEQKPESPEADSNAEPQQESKSHFDVPNQESDSYYQPKEVKPSIDGLPVPAVVKGVEYISPRMRARMDELGLQEPDLSAISGTGSAGRVTIQDLEKFLEDVDAWPREEASFMRLKVADAMRRSWNRPLATVGRPVVLDTLLEHRSQATPKPSLTLYILRAFAIALGEDARTAGYLVGKNIVRPKSIDLGIAVQVADGVMVPVIKDVNLKTTAQLFDEYQNLVELARKRRLTEEQTKGGIATVTNFGTFGLTWGTPIPLPNETLILGMGAGRKEPVWSEQVQAFVPVTQAELMLTFDHRVVDGGDAGILINRVQDLLQTPEEL